MKTHQNTCPTCSCTKVVVLDTRLQKDGTRWWRMKCRSCLDDWRIQDGQVLSDERPRDWRVQACDLCKYCIHQCNGFCSLGFPEATDPAFVSVCVARTLEGTAPVVQ
jgi:hypothetical protein